jgi:hypothetical protein
LQWLTLSSSSTETGDSKSLKFQRQKNTINQILSGRFKELWDKGIEWQYGKQARAPTYSCTHVQRHEHTNTDIGTVWLHLYK